MVGDAMRRGISGGQKKRLTTAEMIVGLTRALFMDEITNGLDSSTAFQIVACLQHFVHLTNGTILVSLLQPAPETFDLFNDIILMALKTGGRVIYCGLLGKHSSEVIDYFEGIPGVAKIRNNYNPSTWMLEVTSSSAESELGVDFGQIYKESALFKNNYELVRQLSSPLPGSKDLHFSDPFSQNFLGQFKSCLWKQQLSYWRSPQYNLMRIGHSLVSSLIVGVLFLDQGNKIDNQQSLFNILGSIFVSIIFMGINNCSSVLPYISTEQTVMYRERFAGMYCSWAYALAQVLVEVPYLFLQAALYTIIVYPMIGYYGSAYKVLWFIYAMFSALLYFNYLGMAVVAMTSSFPVASIVTSASYTMFNLCSGFLIPKPEIPKWWIWLYYCIPTSWSLNGLLTSQYGDIDREIVVFGERKNISAFFEDYFGFHHDQLRIVAAMLLFFPLLLAFLFAFCIGRLNFQRR